jgi:hypothetical protein
MDVVRQQVTAEELLLLPDDGFRYELVLENYARCRRRETYTAA